MAYANRVKLYKKIEEIRKRPLIVYVTSSRVDSLGNPVGGQMGSDVIPEFIKQLNEIPNDKKEIDLLFVSNGGDPTVSWRIISMIRERFDKVAALLPYAAFSAATLLALGADEIYMHPYSCMGPVDPQLVSVRTKPGQPGQEVMQFGAEDLTHFMEFVRKDVGISDQEQMENAFELLCKDVSSVPIGIAKRSSQLSLSMGEKLLDLHMQDHTNVKAIAEAMSKSFYHHGYPVGRKEAKKIGLQVKHPDEALEKLIWQVWEDLEKDMEINSVFDPIKIVLNHPEGAKLIGPVQQVQIPANLPPQLLQQIYNQIMQQIQTIQVNPVDCVIYQATVESLRCYSEYKTEGKINAVRLPDMNIAANFIKKTPEWKFHKNT